MENKEPEKKEFTVPKDMEGDVKLGAAQQIVAGGAKDTCNKIENENEERTKKGKKIHEAQQKAKITPSTYVKIDTNSSCDEGEELAKEQHGRVRVQGVDRTLSEYITRFVEIHGHLLDIESIAYIHYREHDLMNKFFIDIHLKEGWGEPIIIEYDIKLSYEQDKTLIKNTITQYHSQFMRGL